MKSKSAKKGMAQLLAVSLLLSGLPGVSGTSYAAEPSKAQFATQAELLTLFDLDGSTPATAQKVYFGQSLISTEQTWYIAGTDTNGGLVLMCDAARPLTYQQFVNNGDIRDKVYDGGWGCTYQNNPSEVYSNHYGASNLRVWLKGAEVNSNYFSLEEQTKMQTTTITTNDTKNNTTYTTTDKLYAAYGDYMNKYVTVGTNSSASINGGLKIALDKAPYNSGEDFLLRTPSPYVNSLVFAAWLNRTVDINFVTTPTAIVPAFHLDVTSVLFASSAQRASSLSISSGGKLTTEDALTLRYNNAAFPLGSAVINSARTNVAIRGASTDTYFVVQNSDGAWAKQLGTQTSVSAGEVIINSVSLASFEGCKVWLEKTATAQERITEATMAVQANSVTVTPGEHMTKRSGSGEAIQPELEGEMTPVVYTADVGYCFPENYPIVNTNGISVTRIDDRQIEVTGSPEANTVILLEAAPALSYTIEADPLSGVDFGSKNAGYTIGPPEQTVTITNTGNQAVTLTKPESSISKTSYTIGALSKTNLGINETATFALKPKENLPAGTYRETITVSTNQGTSVDVAVTFTVNEQFDLSIHPASVVVIEGDSQVLTATATGGSKNYAYQWYEGTGTTAFSNAKEVQVAPTKTTTYQVMVTDTIEQRKATVEVEVTPASYSIQTDHSAGIDFGSKKDGDASPPEQIVKITNTGNRQVTLTQPESTNYITGLLSKASLVSGETASFILQPKENLLAGTYQETITISTKQGTSATVAVTFQVVEKAVQQPQIIKGAGQTWKKGSKEGISLQSDAPIADFVRTTVDQKPLAEQNFIKKAGSTIITLKPEYLETLALGKYNIEIVSKNGTAKTIFTIEAADKRAAERGNTNIVSPKAGDESNFTLWFLMLLMAGSGLIIAGIRKIRKWVS